MFLFEQGIPLSNTGMIFLRIKLVRKKKILRENSNIAWMYITSYTHDTPNLMHIIITIA